MNLFTFLSHLETALPPAVAMQGDKIGLQLQSSRENIERILVTMEITDAVVDEAVQQDIDCIITFHPLIFQPLSSLLEHERVGRLCSRLIKHSVAVIVAHTNFDAYPAGTSVLCAERLGLEIECCLVPDKDREGFGMGVVARAKTPMSEETLVELTAKTFLSPVRYGTGRGTPVERIAIVGGSGISFLHHVENSCDAFITADCKYHDFHRVQGTVLLIDPGHYEMEQFVPVGLSRVIEGIGRRSGESLMVTRSKIVPNPVRYYPGTTTYIRAQQELLTLS